MTLPTGASREVNIGTLRGVFMGDFIGINVLPLSLGTSKTITA